MTLASADLANGNNPLIPVRLSLQDSAWETTFVDTKEATPLHSCCEIALC